MAIRNDDTLRWYVDGQFVLQYKDPKPIRGSIFDLTIGLKVYFDNLKIYELRLGVRLRSCIQQLGQQRRLARVSKGNTADSTDSARTSGLEGQAEVCSH